MLKNMKHRLCRLLCLALLLCLPLPAYATGITVGGGTNAEQGGTGAVSYTHLRAHET